MITTVPQITETLWVVDLQFDREWLSVKVFQESRKCEDFLKQIRKANPQIPYRMRKIVRVETIVG